MSVFAGSYGEADLPTPTETKSMLTCNVSFLAGLHIHNMSFTLSVGINNGSQSRPCPGNETSLGCTLYDRTSTARSYKLNNTTYYKYQTIPRTMINLTHPFVYLAMQSAAIKDNKRITFLPSYFLLLPCVTKDIEAFSNQVRVNCWQLTRVCFVLMSK